MRWLQRQIVAVDPDGRARDLPAGGCLTITPGGSEADGVQNVLWKYMKPPPGSHRQKEQSLSLHSGDWDEGRGGALGLGPDSASSALLLPVKPPSHLPWKLSKIILEGKFEWHVAKYTSTYTIRLLDPSIINIRFLYSLISPEIEMKLKIVNLSKITQQENMRAVHKRNTLGTQAYCCPKLSKWDGIAFSHFKVWHHQVPPISLLVLPAVS